MTEKLKRGFEVSSVPMFLGLNCRSFVPLKL